MTLKEKLKIYKRIVNDILWMAIRYADGRHTYAPSIIRDTVKMLKEIEPKFKLKKYMTIEPPTEEELNQRGWILKSDYLYDLFEEEK